MGMESNHRLSPYRGWLPHPLSHLLTWPRTRESVREKEAGRLSAERVQFFSLRTKLLFFVAVLVLIPGGIYGALTLSNSRAALAQVIGRQLVEEARNGADRLATTL